MSTEQRLNGRAGPDAVLSALRRATKLVVVTHEHPDGDALGSLVAMQQILASLGKDSVMFIAEGEFPLPYEYRFLSLEGHVTAAPSDLAERTLVFLDCGNIERNPAAEVLLTDGAEIVNIDHHHDNTRFGTANQVDDTASCTAEIIWEVAQALGATITQPIAEALYVGVITDTGCFMYENTTARTHRVTADLIERGVDVHGIYHRVYEDVPYAKLTLLARGLASVERYDDGRLIISQLAAEDFTETGAEESYTEGVIDHLRAIRGTAIAALARDRLAEDGQPALTAGGARVRKVSLRAADTRIDVSAIARVLGGGGHRAAAGLTTSLPWDELVEFLRGQLAEQLQDVTAPA
jgi:bifunctional oligoribonuclease and PAP phosphatase NrnA